MILFLTEDSWNKDQEYQKGRLLLNKSFLGSFSSGKGSPAQEEAVIKLLQLLAGDVETNPGPKVKSTFLYQHLYTDQLLNPNLD